jgi:hypothetical protein
LVEDVQALIDASGAQRVHLVGFVDANPARVRGAGQANRVHKVIPASVKELVALTEAMPEQLRLTVPLASSGAGAASRRPCVAQ